MTTNGDDDSMIVLGQLASADGASFQRGGYETRSIYMAPARSYRRTQPTHIPIDINHDGDAVGEVLFLTHRDHGLFAVGEIDDDVAEMLPERCYLSAEAEGRWNEQTLTYNDLELTGAALVAESATVYKAPVTKMVGTIDDAHLYHHNPHRALLREAADYVKDRRWHRYEPHHITGMTLEQRQEPPIVRSGRPGAIEFSSGGYVLAVR